MNAMKMKKLAAAILTTATMAMFSSGVNAEITISVDESTKIAGQSFDVTVSSNDEGDQSSVDLAILDADNSDAPIATVSRSIEKGKAVVIPITTTQITKNAKVCIGNICSNSFTIRPASFEFKLRKGIDSTDYGNSSFENSDQDKDPFAGQKVYLEVTPLGAGDSAITNVCDKKDQLNLKLSGTLNYSNGYKNDFTADTSKFQFLNNGVAKNCENNKLYIPFRFLDFGLLTLNHYDDADTPDTFSSDFTSEKITNKTDKKLGIFKAAYVNFEGTLTPIQTSPDGLNYMGQPFDTRLVYTAYPQTGDEKAEIDKSTKLESYTYDGNNKKYMFTVGLTKAFDSNNNCYPITDGSTKEEDKCKEEKIIAGYDTSNTDIYSELLRNKERQWEKGEIIFDSLNNGTTPTDETIKYRLRYIRPAKPIEPQTISVFGGVVDGDIPGVPKQASNPQQATKGEAGPITVSFGRLRFTNIMHYDPEKLIVKVIPQKWQNSTWVDAGDTHTNEYIKKYGSKATENDPSFYFRKYDKDKKEDLLFDFDNVKTAIDNGYLKVKPKNGTSKKSEMYVCLNLGNLAENEEGEHDDYCSDTPSTETPWLKGIWTNTGTKYNENPRAHVYYGLKYSAEKEKTVYTRELW